MADLQTSWTGRTLGDRYAIGSLLGQGGMSSVYKAMDPNLQRTVAVKIIHPHLSEHPEFVKRFEQEAAAVAKLRHPNIMQVHDFNHDGQTYYIVFEYVAGDPLDKRLAALKEVELRMPLEDVLTISIKLCDAIAYAHERNMIHRDIKPSNVIINLLGQPILLDFGIAKIVGSDHVHTATGATLGTAAYMSPEQVMGEGHIDHRADIYSLGVMLYEMGAGKPPYQGKSAMTVMMKHVQEPLPDIRLFNSNLPPHFVSILELALAKAPKDRYHSALEMGAALRELAQIQHAITPTQTFVKTPKIQHTSTVAPQPAAEPPASPAEPTTVPVVAEQTNRKRQILLGATAVVGVLALLVMAAFFLRQTFSGSQTPSSAGMVAIPGGTFSVGLNNGQRQYAASSQVTLTPYWIDRFEVTNAEFAAFIQETEATPPVTWAGLTPPAGQEAHPVAGVPWATAVAYCRSVGKRLPTEAEWEVAARGTAGLLYPWGDELSGVPLPRNSTYEVGTYPVNRSPFGVVDMAGNVWEWVDQPYAPVAAGEQVARGGAYDFLKDMAYRLVGNPEVPTMIASVGLRCAADEVELVADATVLVVDDFTNESSGWPIVDETNVLSGYHPPDYYHVQAGQAEQIATAYFGGNFDNIVMEAETFVDSTDTETGDFRYGLILRRNGNQFYAFTISPRAGTWSVLKGTAERPVLLAEGTVAGLAGFDAANPDVLRATASGPNLAFFINGRLITTLTDASYASGDVGFYVETFAESRAHVHYDKVEIDQIKGSPAVPVLLQDDFTNPDSGWPQLSDNQTLSGYHPPNFYHIESRQPNTRSPVFFNRQLSDFTMEADLFTENSDTESGEFLYGLVVRRVGENYYAFMASPRTGNWQVIKNSGSGSEVIANGQDDSLQGTSSVASDRLRVDADGDVLIFHINGRALATVQDDDYLSGDIGFVVETLDEPRVHVHFDSLIVREPEIDLEAAPAPIIVGDVVAEVVPTEAPEINATEPATADPSPESEAKATPAGPQPSSLGMVKVDGGLYTVGSDTAVTLTDFWIDRYEVTNAEYAQFVAAAGAEAPAYWLENDIPTNLGDHPVQSITFETAVAYCQSLHKRLPTEAEWEVAARGPHGWRYPWGNERSRVTLPASGTYPVGSLPTNHSTFGAFDMAGNVWEWVGAATVDIPANQNVLRGGANNFQNDLTFQLVGDPNSSVMYSNAGIRCAADTVLLEPDPVSLLTDDFSDIQSGWFNARAPVGPYFYGYHPTDFYHVQVSQPDGCLTVFREVNFDNVMVEAQIFTAATDTDDSDYRYGLVLRHNGNVFYAFMVSPRSQTWAALKSTANGLELMDEGVSATIRGDTQETRDRLFVVANGTEFTFFVNGELVSQVVDSAYGAGDIGFIVETFGESYAHVHYDVIDVRPLPTSVPIVNNPVANSYPVDSPICQGFVSTANSLESFTSHTVKEGESLSIIGQIFDVTQEEILAANGKDINNPNVIRVGQTIIIPQP